MAYPELIIDREKLQHNARWLLRRSEENGIHIHFITKCFCAYRPIVEELCAVGIDRFGDSRIDNLASIGDLGSSHMLVRIPMISEVHHVVRYANISLNSDMSTMEALSDAALTQDRVHGVVLMMEMGDLREGFMPDEMLDVARRVLNLRGLWLAGIGANFNCYGGVIPEEEQLDALVEMAELIRARYDIPLPIVSGGNSGSLYLMEAGRMPAGITHLRIGEALLLGRETSFGNRVGDLYTDVFTLRTEVIECRRKPSVPTGRRGLNAFGETPQFEDRGMIKRAIVACGRQDTRPETLTPCERHIDFLGASSDHMIFDVTHCVRDIGIGATIDFAPDYAALARACVSPYIHKRLV